MAKTVDENHKIVNENESPAVDLIQQQEEFTFEEEAPAEKESQESVQLSETTEEKAPEPEVEKPEEKVSELKPEPEEKQLEYYLILTGAASYTGCGMRFFKNQPTLVTDETAYKKLLSTGLFVMK